MRRTLLFIACVLASVTMLAQEGLPVEDLQNSGCLARTRGEEYVEPTPTIVLTKEGSILSVQILNYESQCATAGFNVKNSISEGSNGIPSLTINVFPYDNGLDADCICPFNVSFTIRDLETNTFYLNCWWYEGLVTLEEGKPLVLEDITLYATIDGVNYTLKKTLGTATLTKVIKQKTVMRIPAELEYEGQTYAVKTITYNSFRDCTTIKTLDIPESVSTIYRYSFYGCKLDSLIIRGVLESRYINSDLLYGLGTDTKLYVLPSEVEKYKAIYNGPVCPLTEAQDNSDYIPFVKEGKKWNVFRSDFDTGCHLEKYMLLNEGIVKDGKTYMKMYRGEDGMDVIYDTGLFREENRKVYRFDPDRQEELLMFDYALKAGDTYETFSFDEPRMVTYKVLSVSDYQEGPEVIRYDYNQEGSLITHRRYLKKWTVCRTDNEHLQKTWIEGVGSLKGPLGNLYDVVLPNMCWDYLGYVECNDDYFTYLPFSFYDTLNNQIYGCDLPKGAADHSWVFQHQLTYELEGDRLHIYGKAYTNCGPNSYAFFLEKPTDDPSVHKIEFEIQEVEPLANCMSLHEIDFYVPGFDPNMTYIVVDNQGEEHHVINKTQQMVYRAMVEEGKVWKVGTISGNPVQMVDYYYFDGDTIVNGKTCKQMMCQRFVSPEYSNEYGMPTNSLTKVGVWYEEDKKVYCYDERKQAMALKYDFSLEANDTLQFLTDWSSPFIIGPKQTGGLEGFKGVYRNIMMCGDEGQRFPSTIWLEGVGDIDGPTRNPCNPILGDPVPEFLMSCVVGDEVIFLNDGVVDGATPTEARKSRFDFTHTIKTKPKAPRRLPADTDVHVYGEYNDQQLGINLDPLADTYQVSITGESGQVVYERAVNAGTVVALNIDISAYAKGRYTVTIENSSESFVGQFESQATGIQAPVKVPVPVTHIYNLQGQQLSTLQKGLNIVNGQKVYVK